MNPSTSPRFETLPPLALYVHVPWCVRKCPYCDFNSHEARGDVPGAAYVDALLADLDHALPSIRGRAFVSVFIGGGTPSLLSAEAVERLLSGIRSRVALAPQAEVTLEANPGTFERERFAGYRAAGITRLSLGIQSFDARKLSALGRIHDGDEARAATAAALTLFDEVNLDLMYALPEQTVAEAESDVATALAFAPTHLSFYQLTLEPNTRFHRQPPSLPDDDAAADIEEIVHAALATAGYRRYETSAFARPGHECRHNLNYWQFGDYLGIGAGAHSKLSIADGSEIEAAAASKPAGDADRDARTAAPSAPAHVHRIVRQVRYKQPAEYLREAARGNPIQQQADVMPDDIGFEFMLNALRLTEGVPVASFEQRTGYALSIIQPELDRAIERGLLDPDTAWLRPTPLGRRFLNELQSLFLR